MKKILILIIIVVFLIIGCDGAFETKVPEKFFVAKVEYNSEDLLDAYKVHLQGRLKNGEFVVLILYTDIEYSVGDNVVLTKEKK